MRPAQEHRPLPAAARRDERGDSAGARHRGTGDFMTRRLLGLAFASLLFGLLIFRAPAHVQAQQAGGGKQPGTLWTEARLREAVDIARVGKRLTPKAWPNRAKVAVCLSFDTDTEAPLLRDGTTSPTSLSASDFGAESGIPRILA